MSFAFKLPLTLAPGSAIFFENLGLPPARPLVIGGRPADIAPINSPDAAGARELLVTCGGFATKDEALSAGRSARDILLTAAALIRVGAQSAPGEDFLAPSVPVAATGQAVFQHQGRLFAFEEVPKPMFVTATATVTIGEAFLNLMARANTVDQALASKWGVAAELYGHSRFHASPESRFVTLMTVLEILAGKKKRPHDEQAVINKLKAGIKGLNKDKRNALATGLGSLKWESIGGAIYSHVQRILGKDDADFCKRAYNKRSKIAHRGLRDPQILSDCERLDRIVSHLIGVAVTRPTG